MLNQIFSRFLHPVVGNKRTNFQLVNDSFGTPVGVDTEEVAEKSARARQQLLTETEADTRR